MATRGYITLGSGEQPYILKDDAFRYMGNFETFESAQKAIQSSANQQLRYVEERLAGVEQAWRVEDLL